MGNSDTKMKPRHNGVHESLKERNDAIYRDYMDGVCVVDLADKYGVSGYRIVQIQTLNTAWKRHALTGKETHRQSVPETRKSTKIT